MVNHGVHETCQVCTSGLQYFPSTRLRQSGRRLTDHLGSTVAITDSNGTLTSQQRYLPFGGTQRIATLAPHCVCCSAGVRKGTILTFMVSTSSTQRLSDHLGSTSLTTDSAGNVISELRYTAWGEVRYQAGTTSTSYTYTGQYNNTADFGLMYYNARWYDSQLGRFAQADSIVPGGVQGYDRYAYVNNNPVRYTDPSGHSVDCGLGESGCQDNPTYTPPLGPDEDNGCTPDDIECQIENNDEYLVGIGLDLTPDQINDLLGEIDWFLSHIINPLDDISSYLVDPFIAIGGASLAALIFAPAAPLAVSGLIASGVVWTGDQIIGNTKDDLNDLRYKLAMASKGGSEGIKLEMGANIGSWGISVNDESAVEHMSVGAFTPKGTLQATEIYMMLWYLSDYGK